jgi:hypothetical protein
MDLLGRSRVIGRSLEGRVGRDDEAFGFLLVSKEVFSVDIARLEACRRKR